MRRHYIGCKVYETFLRLASAENNVMMVIVDQVQFGGWDEGVDDVHTARTMGVSQPRSAQEATVINCIASHQHTTRMALLSP